MKLCGPGFIRKKLNGKRKKKKKYTEKAERSKR